MDSPGNETDIDVPHVSRTAFVVDALELETDILAAGATRVPLEDDSGQPTQTIKFYDGPNMELTLRGWWLSEHSDTWRLQVPIYEPMQGFPDRVRLVKHDVESDPVDILKRMGLPEHAELVKLGESKLGKMLYQASVVPFAAMRSTSQRYTLKHSSIDASGTDSANGLVRLLSKGDGRELKLTVAKLELDISHAEMQTVSNILFTMGNSAPSVLKATSTTFTLKDMSPGVAKWNEVIANLRSDLADFVKSRCLISAIPAPEIPPELYAYLGTLRPRHLTILYKGFVLTPSQELERRHSSDRDDEVSVSGVEDSRRSSEEES